MSPTPWHVARMAALDFESSDKNPATARIVTCAFYDALQSARTAWLMGDIAHRPAADRPDWVRRLRDGGARFNLLAGVSLEELFERQQAWHREWAENFQEFKRRTDPTAVINGDWPIQGGAA